MTSQYFQIITPKSFFPPVRSKDIYKVSPDEQFDGLEHLLYDAAGAYARDDYEFYVYWTGFLYALSRSDILELVWYMGTYDRLHSQNPTRHMLVALILAYFLKYLYKYIRQIHQKNPRMLQNPFFDHLINTLLQRGYMESRNKLEMVIEVLTEMLNSHDRSIEEFRDLIKLVLEILNNPLIKIFGLIKHK